MSSGNSVRDNTIMEVRDSPTIDEICRFRARVWTATPGASQHAFPSGEWRDDIDSWARHWIGRSPAGELVAAARLAIFDRLEHLSEAPEYLNYGLQADGQIAAPDRVVVAPAEQGQGWAGLLLDAQHAASSDSGAVCALRQASPRMARLLERRGWQMLGPASIDPRFPQTQFTVAAYIFDAARVRYRTCRQAA